MLRSFVQRTAGDFIRRQGTRAFSYGTGNVFLKNGTVVNCDRQRENCDVLVTDGKVAAVGTGLEAPSDAKVFEK